MFRSSAEVRDGLVEGSTSHRTKRRWAPGGAKKAWRDASACRKALCCRLFIKIILVQVRSLLTLPSYQFRGAHVSINGAVRTNVPQEIFKFPTASCLDCLHCPHGHTCARSRCKVCKGLRPLDYSRSEYAIVCRLFVCCVDCGVPGFAPRNA